MRQQVFSAYIILFFAICFSLIKKVSLWKGNPSADESHLSSLAEIEPFTVDGLSSFVVIKEHVVQVQIVLHYSGFYKSSNFFNHHKDLTSSEIADGAVFRFAGYSFSFMWNKNPSSSLMFTVVLMKVSMFEMRRLFC